MANRHRCRELPVEQLSRRNRARCGCGWHGPYRVDFLLALDDLIDHEQGRPLYRGVS